MLRIGNYKCRGVDVTLGHASSGSEQIEVLLEVTEGESKGERISWFGSFAGEAAPITLRQMRLLGWELGKPPEACKRLVADVEVFDEQYQGRSRRRARLLDSFVELRTPPDARVTGKPALDVLARAVARVKAAADERAAEAGEDPIRE
jgi:hypothetical protein